MYKNSYLFSEKERLILFKFLNFFKYEISNGNGSFLLMLDLENINFKWCADMVINDNDVFGAWSVIDSNTIYVRPNEFSKSFQSFIESKNDKKLNVVKSIYKKVTENSFFNELDIDQELINFVLYLCENQGMILSTIFHELYHKWQYNSNKICYLFNNALTKLIRI